MRPKFKYNEKVYNNGIDLQIHIDFTKCKDNPNEMELVSCAISKGFQCCDYAFTTDNYTLTDIINEFIDK